MSSNSGKQCNSGERWYKSPFGKLLIAGPLLTALLTALVAAYVDYERGRCEKVALADLLKAKAAVERFAQECKDLGWPRGTDHFSDEHIKYLVGPYYGWFGTDGRCAVVIRMRDRQMQGCAKMGRFPSNNKTERTIYQVDLETNGQPTSTVGACRGRQYGWLPDAYYTSSMVVIGDYSRGRDFSLTEPMGAIRDD